MGIRWTEPAARDLTGICNYTQDHHGPKAARKLALRIYEAIGSLPHFPYLGRLGRKAGTRELVIGQRHFRYEFHAVHGGHDWNQWEEQLPTVFQSLLTHISSSVRPDG